MMYLYSPFKKPIWQDVVEYLILIQQENVDSSEVRETKDELITILIVIKITDHWEEIIIQLRLLFSLSGVFGK